MGARGSENAVFPEPLINRENCMSAVRVFPGKTGEAEIEIRKATSRLTFDLRCKIILTFVNAIFRAARKYLKLFLHFNIEFCFQCYNFENNVQTFYEYIYMKGV